MLLAIIILQVIQVLSVLILACAYVRLSRRKMSEYYTDYQNGKLIIRIFKPEFEYQAIGNIQRGKILDRGVFSKYYCWALIEL